MLACLALVTALSLPQGRTIEFSGQDWKVKAGPELMGPGPNFFSDSPRDVWVDDIGRLHLTVRFDGRKWLCTEVISTKSYGYGKYTIETGPIRDFDPNIVFGMFTWDTEPAFDHREVDIEYSRWGDPKNPNGQFAAQPYSDPGHVLRFPFPEEAQKSSHIFRWRSNRVDFRVEVDGSVVKSYTIAGKVPPAGNANFRLNLWLIGGKPLSAARDYEVIVEDFRFEPG